MEGKEVKHIFIDSNIYLDLYRFGQQDLDKLNELVEHINDGDIKLYLTKQTIEEFYRNREEEFKRTFDTFNNSKITISMNAVFKNYLEYEKINRLQQVIDKIKSTLSEKVQQDVQKKELSADKVIQKLFSIATIVETDKYLPSAIKRHQLGNPPGKKNNSYGDEINWEAFLDFVEADTKFIIISRDGDYKSPMFEGKVNDFLLTEWKDKKKSDLYLYNSLGDFFREHDIKINFEIEEIKTLLVNELINSGSFMNTHEIVRKLDKYSSFSDEQIKGLATALLGNTQVSWVIEDPDVNGLYKSILLSKLDLFDSDVRSQLEAYLFVDKVQINEEVDKIIAYAEKIENEQTIPVDMPF